MAQNLLTITQAEWTVAKAFFEKNPKTQKLSRNPLKNQLATEDKSKIQHSFINVKGVVYAVDHQPKEPDSTVKESSRYLGSGGMAKAKLIQNEAGDNFVLKRRLARDGSTNTEVSILKRIGRYIGDLQRLRFINPLQSNDGLFTKKYTIESYIEGQSLSKAIKEGKYTRPAKLLEIAFKAAIALKKLMHDNGIMHLDIKPGNIMVNDRTVTVMDSDQTPKTVDLTEVDLIDFNGSRLIGDQPQDANVYTEGYDDQREIKDLKSDIYSLGVVFAGIHDRSFYKNRASRVDAELVENINPFLPSESFSDELSALFNDMRNEEDSASRPSIETVIDELRKEILDFIDRSEEKGLSEEESNRLKIVLRLEEHSLTELQEKTPTPTSKLIINEPPKAAEQPHKEVKKTSLLSIALTILKVLVIACTFIISIPIILYLKHKTKKPFEYYFCSTKKLTETALADLAKVSFQPPISAASQTPSSSTKPCCFTYPKGNPPSCPCPPQ